MKRWNLEAVLPLDYVVDESCFVNAPLGTVENFAILLSRDVFSEGDAQFFYNYVQSRNSEFSADFLSFMDCWLADELHHYEALRRVYRGVAGVSFDEMNLQMAKRIPNIEPIKLVLKDEFTILVTFMFDEMGSCISYRRDLSQYYAYFGKPIQKIAHHLVKDEGKHFNLAAELLLQNHRDRFKEIPALLTQIAALEASLDTYYKTFFLDHAQEKYRFPPQFNDAVICLIKARLGIGIKPKQSEVRELWQWQLS